MATRFASPITQYVNDDASNTGSGWKLNFYSTGTLTRKDTFSDTALTTANANPVVADSSGRFADIFLESGTYKVVLTDDVDVEKWTADPVEGSVGTSGAVDSKTASYTVVVDDSTKFISVDATSGNLTVTLLASATAGNGFEVGVGKNDSSANTVTVDGNGAEAVGSSATYILRQQSESVTVRADGSNWVITSTTLENLYSFIQKWAKGADIASATTVVVGTDGNSFDITGNTGPIGTITVAAGTWFAFQFDSTPTLTNGATMVLPGAVDFTAAAGDVLVFFAHAANQVTCMSYALASGKAVTQSVAQQVYSSDGAVATGTTVTVLDDTIPQNTEGDEYLSVSITPKNASNLLVIEAMINGSTNLGGTLIVGLFQDSTANALAAVMEEAEPNNSFHQARVLHRMTAGTTSSTTFKIRAGGQGGTYTFNGVGAARRMGGAMASYILVTEISA